MFTIVSQTPRNDALTLRQVAYLTKGLIQSSDFHLASAKATEFFGYGEDSLLESLQVPASLLADIYDSNENHPGGFEYEVTEKVGAFLAEYLAVPENEGSVPWDVVVEYANQEASKFFAKYQALRTISGYSVLPNDLYTDLLNYLESCCETERHNPDDPCHALLSRLDAAGERVLVEIQDTDAHDHVYAIQPKE